MSRTMRAGPLRQDADSGLTSIDGGKRVLFPFSVTATRTDAPAVRDSPGGRYARRPNSHIRE